MVRIEVVAVDEASEDSFQEPTFRGWNYIKRSVLFGLRASRKFWKQVSIGVVVLVMVVGLVIFIRHRDTSGFPSDIKHKANFSIFYPTATNASLEVERPTILYNDANHGLSYQVYIKSIEVIVSEQATPDIFSESGVYSFKLSQAHQFDTLDTNAGEVALTKPSDIGGQVVAWDNSKGTLLLARAYGDLSTADWKLLFNSLTIVN